MPAGSQPCAGLPRQPQPREKGTAVEADQSAGPAQLLQGLLKRLDRLEEGRAPPPASDPEPEVCPRTSRLAHALALWAQADDKKYQITGKLLTLHLSEPSRTYRRAGARAQNPWQHRRGVLTTRQPMNLWCRPLRQTQRRRRW